MNFFLKEKIQPPIYKKKENFFNNFLFCFWRKGGFFLIFLSLTVFAPFFVCANSSLLINPSSETVNEGDVFSAHVLLRGEGDTVEGTLNFDSNLLTVQDISEDRSVIEAWSPGGRPTRSGDNIVFSGGVPGGLRTSEGNIFTVRFRAVGTGTASVSFAQGRVLEAGQSIDASLGSANYTIRERETSPTQDPAPSPATTSPPPPPPGDTFFENETNIAEEDPFVIEIDNEGDPANPSPFFVIKKSDDLPEIKYYEVLLNGDIYSTLFPDDLDDKRYQLSSLSPGDYLLEVRAFDEDDNYTSSSVNFSVAPAFLEVKEISSSITEGNPLKIIGQTLSDIRVRIYILIQNIKEKWMMEGELAGEVIEKEDKKVVVKEIFADSDGNFSFEEIFPKGEYLVWVEVEDEEGVVRSSTEEFFVEIKAESWVVIMIVSMIVLILIGIAFILYFRAKIKRKKEKEVVAQEDKSSEEEEAYNLLEETVKEQIAYLEDKTDLSRGEKRILEELKGALNNNAHKEEGST